MNNIFTERKLKLHRCALDSCHYHKGPSHKSLQQGSLVSAFSICILFELLVLSKISCIPIFKYKINIKVFTFPFSASAA